MPSRPVQRDGLDGWIPWHCSSAVVLPCDDMPNVRAPTPGGHYDPFLARSTSNAIHCSALGFPVPARLSRNNRSSTRNAWTRLD